MDDLKKLQCTNCGAALREISPGRYRCEYCGALYEETFGHHFIQVLEVDRSPAVKLEACVAIGWDIRGHMEEKAITEYTLHEMRNQLAEALTGYLKIQTHEDPRTMATIIHGSVRVLPPNVKY